MRSTGCCRRTGPSSIVRAPRDRPTWSWAAPPPRCRAGFVSWPSSGPPNSWAPRSGPLARSAPRSRHWQRWARAEGGQDRPERGASLLPARWGSAGQAGVLELVELGMVLEETEDPVDGLDRERAVPRRPAHQADEDGAAAGDEGGHPEDLEVADALLVLLPPPLPEPPG